MNQIQGAYSCAYKFVCETLADPQDAEGFGRDFIELETGQNDIPPCILVLEQRD